MMSPQKSKRRVLLRKPLPPHSNEAWPLARQGEVNKPLVITAITVVIIIGLVVLMFYSKGFVGQAIKLQEKVPEQFAGIFLEENTVAPGEKVVLPVMASIGKDVETVALAFTLTVEGLSCKDIGFENKVAWKDEILVDSNKGTCTSIKKGTETTITYELSTVDPAVALKGNAQGLVTLAELTFTAPAQEKTLGFKFTNIEINGLATKDNLVFTHSAAEVKVVKPGVPAPPVEDTCTDPDNAHPEVLATEITYTEGGISFASGDKCLVSKDDVTTKTNFGPFVQEAYCNGAKAATQILTCAAAEICNKGACVAKCQETDEGKNFSFAGTLTLLQEKTEKVPGTPASKTTYSWKDFDDYCIDAADASLGKKVDTSDFVYEYSCKADGGAVTEVKKCSVGEECVQGACAKKDVSSCTDPDKTVNEDFSANTLSYEKATTVTAVAANGTKTDVKDSCAGDQLVEAYCKNKYALLTTTVDCAAGQTCQNGACVKKEIKPAVTCEDSDNGKNYTVEGSVKNLAAPGTAPTYDTCQDGKLTEMFCTAEGKVSFEVHTCAVGEECKAGACIVKAAAVDVLVLEVTDVATSKVLAVADKVGKGKSLKIKATVTPDKDLPKNHLLIVQVQVGTTPKALIYDTKNVLTKGSKEVLEFSYDVPNDATEKVSVKAFVWGNWPSTGTGNNLVPLKSVSYELQ